MPIPARGPIGLAAAAAFAAMPVHAMVGDLEHWQDDTFLARWLDRELRADAYVTFALDSDGPIDQAKMSPASEDVDFSFDFQDLLLRPVPAMPGRAAVR